MHSDHLSETIFSASQWATGAYLLLVLAIVVRLEVLKAQRRLPKGFSTVTSPLRWKTGLWSRIMGDGQRERQGRLFRLLFTDQHIVLGDSWVTALVYMSRLIFGVVVTANVALLAAGLLASRH